MNAYEANEAAIFIRDRNRACEGTKAEIKAAALEFADAMANNPAIVAERIGWLLNGSYGRGSYDAACRVAKNPRMNREAWLVQVIGSLEWMAREVDTRKAFNAMTDAQKAILNSAVRAEIEYFINEQLSEVQS